MKTAMQEVQEAFQKYQDIDFFNWYMDNRIRLLETEKRQLLFFYDSGVSANVSAEQFYEQTFKNK